MALDGDFFSDYPSALIASQAFIKIPLITGSNTDEGTSFSANPKNPSTDAELATWLHTWRGYNLSTLSITVSSPSTQNTPTHPIMSLHPSTFPTSAQSGENQLRLVGIWYSILKEGRWRRRILLLE